MPPFKRRSPARLLAAASMATMALVLSAGANASLIYTGTPITIPGGVGNSSTILSLQSPGSTTTETGAVGPAGRTGDALNGANTPVPIQPLSQENVTSAADLVIFWDVQEPGGNAITLDSLVLNIYGPAGNDALLFSASLAGGPLTLDPTFPGQGNNPVFAFVLDAAQAQSAQQSFNSLNRIGLSASASQATGGPDRFFFGSRQLDITPTGVISEPGVVALLSLALAGIGFMRIRRR
jgi:hypothetical protein